MVGSISDDQAICYNTTAEKLIGIAPTGGSGMNAYQWQVSTDNSSFTDISEATSLDYQPGALIATTYYQLVQTSVGGCGEEITDAVTIIVYPEFVVGTISGTQTICYDTSPDEFIGIAPTGADGNYEYQWQYSTDGTTFTDVSGATDLDYQAGDLIETTHYQLIQTSAYGCGEFITNQITVNVYSFVAHPIIVEKKEPGDVSLLVVDNSLNLYFDYLWSYSDGSDLPFDIVNDRQFLTLPPNHMNATYMVTAYDQNTCGVTSLSKTVTLNKMASSIYPTISNGNFNMKLAGPEIGAIKVTIYNEVGRLLKSYQFEKTMNVETKAIYVNDLGVGSYLIEISINNYKKAHRVFIR